MAFRLWQVGLEIGNGAVRALAVQRRRGGWQLRHWWQRALPAASLNEREGSPCDGVGRLLAEWRKQLPGSISLRVCLPAHLFSQRRINAPDRRLREPEREWYVGSHAKRHFPEDSGPLLFDYQDDPLVPNTLLVTAARQTAVAQWQSCLSAAGLDPQIMDFMPCALRCMARHAELERNAMLIHGLDDGWCWISPLSRPLEFGFVRREDALDFEALRRIIGPPPSGERGAVCPGAYFSSIAGADAPKDALAWPPFDTFWQIFPPVPPRPQAFLIAGGLALRPEDA